MFIIYIYLSTEPELSLNYYNATFTNVKRCKPITNNHYQSHSFIRSNVDNCLYSKCIDYCYN